MTIPRKLADEDSIIFLHILKTAGLTFNSILAELFPWDQIHPFVNPVEQTLQPGQGPYPARATSDPLKQLHKNFNPINPETNKPYRLILGHWDFGVVERYPYLLPITFLRDPITQMISIFKHIRRHNDAWNPMYEKLQKMSIIEWANDPQVKALYANSQARQISGGLYSFPENAWTAETIIEKALENLQKCVFIGLTERFEESLLALAYTFSWEPITTYTRRNMAPEPSDAASLTSREYEAVRTLCELDMVVYEFAKQLYNQRLSSMMQNLFENSDGDPSPLNQPAEFTTNTGQNTYAKRIFYPHLQQQIRCSLAAKAKIANDEADSSSFDPKSFSEKLTEFKQLYKQNEFQALARHLGSRFEPSQKPDYQTVIAEYPHYQKLVVNHPALMPVVEQYVGELRPFTQAPFPLPGEQVIYGPWMGSYKTTHFPICEVTEETVLNKRVLDIGCNAGFDSFYFASLGASEVIGIEPSPFVFQAMFLRTLYNCPNLRFARMRWQDISTTTFGTFDIINCQGILYHEPSPVMLIQALFGFLQPGGKLVLETHVTLKDDMNALFVEGNFWGDPNWWWIPSINVTAAMLRSCGFVDVQFRASVPAASRNPDNPDYTVEGVPVGGRAFFTAIRPTGSPIRKPL